MSATSELRERVTELENRISILESALVRLLDKTNIQDLSGDLMRVPDEDDFEARTRIGFK